MKVNFIIFLFFISLSLFPSFNSKNCTSNNYTEKMFCFQCSKTFNKAYCIENGMCGKNSNLSILQDNLIGALITLAQKERYTKESNILIIKSLYSTITNTNFDENYIKNLINDVHKTSGDENDFCLSDIWNSNEDIRSLKSLILFSLKGMAACAYNAFILGYEDEEVNFFFYEVLQIISEEKYKEKLFPIFMQLGEINFKCLKLLEEANINNFGEKNPIEVNSNIESGPFIIISGNDLVTLKWLLLHIENKNINIYTHGEMVIAHSYPELKKYKNLKGNIFINIENLQKDFNEIPAPILFTSDLLISPNKNNIEKIFTTNVVKFPNITYLGKKEFREVFQKSLELGGYKESQKKSGKNNGNKIITGFGRKFMISKIDEILNLIKLEKIKHFFILIGCDYNTNDNNKNYYTEFVKKTPNNTIILTVGSLKFLFNDLKTEKIGNFPKIIDMGQLTDIYGTIQFILALSKKININNNINELPLSIIFSWYDEKTISIFSSLLYLGIKNIKIGPDMPPFISTNVWKILVNYFDIDVISTPDEDLKKLLG